MTQYKLWKLLLVLCGVAILSGCGDSNSFDRSPCACDFRPINNLGDAHA